MPSHEANPLRQLPAVHSLLNHPLLLSLQNQFTVEEQTRAIREVLNITRHEMLTSQEREGSVLTTETLAIKAISRLYELQKQQLQPVINATGILLHTNLGRAPLAKAAGQAAFDAARYYTNLELDLASGQRSKRQDHVRGLVARLCGAESATVVNNCAAATILTLRVVAAGGGEVIISRGQLLEIGGGFRIPEIMMVSGAQLVEVGTTNRTNLADYERAIRPQTSCIMRVHSSNFRQVGFTASVSIQELAQLGRKHNIPVIDDVGSGQVDDLSKFGAANEPMIREGIAAGADLVLFSGDKLFCGPQAGMIAGKQSWISKLEADPMMRAFRCDKMTLAALHATAKLWLDHTQAMAELPLLRMLQLDAAAVRQRIEQFLERYGPFPQLQLEIASGLGYVGGGTLPEQALPTAVLTVHHAKLNEQQLATHLRTARRCIVGTASTIHSAPTSTSGTEV